MFKHKLKPELRVRSGVTLIELILVLAISSFMIVLALGGFNGRNRASFDRGADQVLSSLRSVQNEATSGQWQGRTDCGSAQEDCLQSGEQLVGKGVTLSTLSGDVIDDTYSGFLNFRQNFSVSNNLAGSYVEYTVVRAGGSLNTTVGPRLRSIKNFPSDIKLKSIKVDDKEVTSAMLVFARGSSGGEIDATTRSAVSPHVYLQRYFIDGVGFPTPAQQLANYNTTQNSVVTLEFVNPNNTGMTSTIVITTATGAMELKK